MTQGAAVIEKIQPEPILKLLSNAAPGLTVVLDLGTQPLPGRGFINAGFCPGATI
ncbi:hypothetical protein L0128_02655 [candidate division KSB1 bacterium]|nr:hypothetical protein [candidate division KSB1 bacterium]